MNTNQIETIGNTPCVQLNTLQPLGNLFAKVEGRNPLFCVKCRTAWGMVKHAEESGLLKRGASIVEPTSGNTGLALAWISNIRGYNLTLTMPASMSNERKEMLRFLGANLVLTDASEGMKGTIQKAEEIAAETGAVYLDQFSHPGNPQIHYETTGPEIWKNLDGNVDIAVFGVGTGGTLSGTGRFLKEKNPDIRVVAVEPEGSQVIAGKEPGSHKIQGIGAGFIPKNLDVGLIDIVQSVTSEEAFETSKRLARKEGIVAGISSGAALHAALQLAEKFPQKRVIVILPDTAERYISTPLFTD